MFSRELRISLCGLILLTAGTLWADYIIYDEFDDGDLAINSTGVGSGFAGTGSKAASAWKETDGQAIINATNNGNRDRINSLDSFDTTKGLTATWVISDIARGDNNGGAGRMLLGLVDSAGNLSGSVKAETVDGFWIALNYDEGVNSGMGIGELIFINAGVKTSLATWQWDLTGINNSTGTDTPWDIEDAEGSRADRVGLVFNYPIAVVLTIDASSYSLSFDAEGKPVPENSLSGAFSGTVTNNSLTSAIITAYCQGPNIDGIPTTLGFDLIVVGDPVNKVLAVSPSPQDGAEDVLRDGVELQWKSGAFAQTHDVYLSNNFDDVNEADINNSMGAIVFAGLDVNSLPLDRLELGEIYYWRVDEVNAPADPGLYKGNVWSFEVEPEGLPIVDVNATASSMLAEQFSPLHTVDGSGLDEEDKHSATSTDMWISAPGDPSPSITFEFTDTYKLHELLIWNANGYAEPDLGYGVKDVKVLTSTDGINWDLLGAFEVPQGPGQPGYAANPPLALNGVLAKFVLLDIQSNWSGVSSQYSLSEVCFTSLPVMPREPNPAHGSTNLAPQQTLSWRAGREADQHEVRLGTDPNTLDLVTTSDTPSYEASLDLAKTYYWQITEVNESETPSTWTGDIWRFSTADYLTVDDMESYKTSTTENSAEFYVWEVWKDGTEFGTDDPTNGSIVGANPIFNNYWPASGLGRSLSLPIWFDNTTVSRSEVTNMMSEDWTKHGIQTLSLVFQGAATNTTGQLYVQINDTKIPYDGAASDLTLTQWVPWHIDLSSVDGLQNVTQLIIGIEGANAKGVFYVDDIRLYTKAGETIIPVTPDNTGILASYSFEGDYQDGSGNGLNGTAVGAAAITSDSQRGSVLILDGANSCVDLGADNRFNFPGSFTLAAWVNIPVFTTNWGHVIVSKRGENDLGWQLRRHSTGTNLTFTVRGTDAADDPRGTVDMSAYYNEWVQVTAVYDQEAGMRSVYVNGLLDVAVVDGGVVAATDHNVYIGARATPENDGQESQFPGMIDEVRIYNRALSQAEALGLTGRTAPLYMPF